MSRRFANHPYEGCDHKARLTLMTATWYKTSWPGENPQYLLYIAAETPRRGYDSTNFPEKVIFHRIKTSLPAVTKFLIDRPPVDPRLPLGIGNGAPGERLGR